MVNPHVTSALWAGVLTIIVAAGARIVMDTPAARLGDYSSTLSHLVST